MTDSNSDLILTRRDGPIVTVTLNRPDKRNAINWPMLEALHAAFDAIDRMTGVRVVVLRGEGRVFSAGIDLMGFESLVAQFGEHYRDNLFPLTQAMQGVLNRIERGSLPVIAALHGACLGLGLELALACDLRVVVEGTRLALPETRLGLIPDVGGTTRLTRLLGPGRAKEIILTGGDIALGDAERWGLVNRVTAPDALDTALQTLAGEIAAAAPLAVSYAKKVIDGVTDLERGLALEAWAQSVLMRSHDFELGVQAALTRQPPEWTGK